jgi:hypothetical protein
VSVHGRLDAAPAAIEQLCADVVLQLGDYLGHSGLRDPQLRSGFGQAAGLHDDQEDAEVSESQPPSDVTVPINDFWHKQML